MNFKEFLLEENEDIFEKAVKYDGIEYIKGATLSWSDLWDSLGMSKDSGGRWYPGSDTPEWIAEYCKQFRTPSRAWPHSYAKPLLTQKFAKMLCEKDPELAVKLGVAVKSPETI